MTKSDGIIMSHTSPTNKSTLLKRGIIVILCVLYIAFYAYKNPFTHKFILLTKNSTIVSMTMSHHYLIINENNKTVTSLYYRNAISGRNSSYPFISGDTFRAFADHIFDETRQDNFASVKYGDIVFVKADMTNRFFGKPYELINTSFVLVSHNSDFSAPSEQKNRLNDGKIIAWYGSNPNLRNHSKFFPIPIGLANTRWGSGDINKLTHAFEKYRKPWSNRTNLLYVNFDVNTNPQARQPALTQASKFTNVKIIKEKISFEIYLEHLGNSKFVLSPPGNGLDCHRTWEALMMGAAPVIRSSELDPLFDGIPVVVIPSWTNLTESFLLLTTFSSYDNNLIPVALYARYWRERLVKHRNR